MTGPHDEDDVSLLSDRDADYLGDYPSVEAYFRRALEDLLVPDGLWLLDCLDMTAVRRRFEADGRFRYILHAGRVHRVQLES